MYSYEEVLAASEKYFNGDKLAAKVFTDKYSLRNEKNELTELTPDEMHHRLAKEFARIEAKKFKKPLTEEQIYKLFYRFRKLIPQGSPMTAIGNPYHTCSTSNCFVVPPPEDSYGGILLTDQHIVQISKRRGGIGYDISTLRPKEMLVSNSARTTTGATSFMHRFSNSGREVGQGGRRGAQMISISVHHPDIIDFITIKNDETSVTGANISVRLSNEFLSAVENDSEYQLRWPVDSATPKVSKTIKAKAVWDAIVHNAWLRAEPGILFWDNILTGPADCYPQFISSSTNPCSEIPLSNYDSCRLLAINLFSYINKPFSNEAKFDYYDFHQDVIIAQRLMDDLIDLELEAIDKIIAKIKKDPENKEVKDTELQLWKRVRESCANGRRTGLGITGLGDTLAALGIKYGSNQSIEETERIYKTLKFAAYRSSIDMAKELGAFPAWDASLETNNEFLNRIKEEDIYTQNNDLFENPIWQYFHSGKQLWEDMQQYGRRNVAILTTAPTGTLSILSEIAYKQFVYCNISSGIEPAIMLEMIRRKKINHDDKKSKVDFTDKVGDKWTNFVVYHSGLQLWKDITGEEDITKSPYYGATAEEIDWEQRVRLQAAAQKHICHAISATVNLPENVKEEEVGKIYREAWKSGCKGITVYRKNSRSGVLVENKTEVNKFDKRPKELTCDVHHVTVKGVQYFVLIGLDSDGSPYEIFAGKNGFLDKHAKTGKIIRKGKNYKAIFDDDDKTELSPITNTCTDHEETITRLSSALLRSDNLLMIIEQLEKIHGDVTSFAKALARTLKKYVKDGTKSGQICSECSNELIYAEGCKRCSNCGWSACG